MKCTAAVDPAVGLRDEVGGDPCCARRKRAHVMSDFTEFDPLRLATDDLPDATTIVWFGNRIDCPSQYQRRHRRGGWYEQRRAGRRPSIAEPGKIGACKRVVGCR